MNTFQVTFKDDEGRHVEDVEATSAGQAFAKCQVDHPGAEMIQADKQGGFLDGVGYSTWTPPPIQRDPIKEPRPYHVPKPDDHEGVMPFYDEVVTKQG